MGGSIKIKRVLCIFGLSVEVKPGEPDQVGEDTYLNIYKGVNLWKTGNFDVMVLDGGLFARGQTTPLAELMKNVLMRSNSSIAENQIIINTDSVTTREHLQRLPDLLAEHGFNIREDELTVVSERFHAWGIGLLFRVLFKNDPTKAYSGQILGWRGLFKRILSLPYYLICPKGTEPWDLFGKKEAEKRRTAAKG